MRILSVLALGNEEWLTSGPIPQYRKAVISDWCEEVGPNKYFIALSPLPLDTLQGNMSPAYSNKNDFSSKNYLA